MTEVGRRWQKGLICLLLGLAVVAVFWPALRFGFVQYDDTDYVTKNVEVQNGLNSRSIKWAFTTSHAANWHPITWLSHAADCQLYGLKPAGHHLTSVLLHAANSILLLLLLNRLTSAFWPSVFVAAIFALHPLRVESVVWIAERKDVLSTFFWLLTAGAYVRYAENLKSNNPRFKLFFALALALFALGLMAKPMLVTLPFILLLLDYWPLGRLQFGPNFSWRPVVEKIPFLILAAGDCVVTFLIQRQVGAVQSLHSVSLGERLANIPVAYVCYIGKNLWPSGLAVYYPFQSLGILEAAGALCVVAIVSYFALIRWRAKPYLALGWLWFLGMLIPVIGLVQVGNQAMADRYSYLPSVGLWIMLAWSARDWIDNHQFPRALTAMAAGAATITCVILTSRQITYWRDSRTLFARAAAVTDHAYTAYYNLGCFAKEDGKYPDAILCFKKALDAEPDNTPWADHSAAYNDLGYSYLQLGDLSNAVASFEKALVIQPSFPEAYYNMGCAFLKNIQPAEAVNCLQRALALDANVAAIHNKLANALAQMGQVARAIAEYREALRLGPNMDEAANNLAWLLATSSDHSLRNGAEALALARKTSERGNDQNPVILSTLAAAYAEAGNRSEALATARLARQLALDQNNKALVEILDGQLRDYLNDSGSRRP